MNANANCDGNTENKCSSINSQVRLLPYGGEGNLILCHACYVREMIYRRQRNFDLAKDCQFDLPAWTGLKIYQTN